MAACVGAAMDDRRGIAGALAQQADLRSAYLEPLLARSRIARSPSGYHDAERDQALFPRNAAWQRAEIGSAVATRWLRNRQRTPAQLVRAHIESVFNNATKNYGSRANQFGWQSRSRSPSRRRIPPKIYRPPERPICGGQTWTASVLGFYKRQVSVSAIDASFKRAGMKGQASAGRKVDGPSVAVPGKVRNGTWGANEEKRASRAPSERRDVTGHPGHPHSAAALTNFCSRFHRRRPEVDRRRAGRDLPTHPWNFSRSRSADGLFRRAVIFSLWSR